MVSQPEVVFASWRVDNVELLHILAGYEQHLTGSADGEMPGAFQPGGTVGVTALCSETLEAHNDDGSRACSLEKGADDDAGYSCP